MHSILYLGLLGFYTRALAEGGSGPAPGAEAVVHHEGRVLDATPGALAKGVKVGALVSEAKAVLREGGRMVAYAPDDYAQAREEWLDVCCVFSDSVEPGMPHEAYLDLSGHPDPRSTAESLVALLARPVVAGLAPGKWVARLGAREVDHEALKVGIPVIDHIVDVPVFLSVVPTSYLSPLTVEQRQRLEFLGYRWAREVATAEVGVLAQQFGKDAFLIHECSRGRALDAVVPSYPRDAVSRRIGFGRPLEDRLELDQAVAQLCSELACELNARDATARGLMVVVERESGAALVLKRRLAKPVQTTTLLQVAVAALLKGALDEPLSALKVQLSGLEPAPRGQRSLMGMAGKSERARACDVAVGTVKASFGDESVVRAAEMEVARRVRVLRAWKSATGWS